MNTLLVLPVIVPIGAAAFIWLFNSRPRIQHALVLVTVAATLTVACLILRQTAAGGVHSTQIGHWPAPYGITFVVDGFSTLMLLISTLIGGMAALFSIGDTAERRHAGYFPLFFILLGGVNGAFLTGDLFNLYVWFEVLLMASFVLMALGGQRTQIEGAVKYVMLNLAGSTLLLAGIGIIYGLTGTLNMADLADKLAGVSNAGRVNAAAMLLLVAFGIKSAIFPFFFWLPASYHTPPPAVAALFAGLLTKVGIYALIRMFTLVFVADTAATFELLRILAGLTMISGVLGALIQKDMRRLFAFLIVSEIGFVLMGIGFRSERALTGTIFFLMHMAVVKSTLFLMTGVIEHWKGTVRLDRLGSLFEDHPAFGYLFLGPVFALAGLPPLSGFWGKYILVQAGLIEKYYLLVGVALAVSLTTLWAVGRIWMEAFWRPASAPKRRVDAPVGLLRIGPIVVLAAVTFLLGLWAEPFHAQALQAAGQLLHPSAYMQAVLGGP
jgi:multicomponent Na+:H+ antiporter subunit D